MSPDNMLVAFVRNGTALWTIDLHTRALKQVGNFGNAHSPTWDASGRRIAFSGNPGQPASNDGYGVWIVNRDGTNIHKLPGGDLADQYPVWSPDGQWIVWTHGQQLWISDTLGVKSYALTNRVAREFEFALSWSNDSQTLLYAASDGGPAYELRTIRVDGTGQRADSSQLVTELPEGVRLAPDEGHLYQSLWVRGESGIQIVERRPGGRSRTVLISSGYPVGAFAVARDQRFVVYAAAPDEDSDECLSLLRLPEW